MDPFKATGKPHTLWVAFAKFYEDNGQLDDVSVGVNVSVGVAYGRLTSPLPHPSWWAGSQPGLCLPRRPESSWRKPPR